MSSNKFHEIAKSIVRNDRELFNTLLEFEKTKKIRSKTKLNFTIDKSLASNLKKLCKEKGYNMSAKIEKAMEEIISKN